MEKRLSDLRKGESGIIKLVEESEAKMKLMELGCVPGNAVTLKHIAPLGNPIAITISGYELSMRKEQAELIILE